MKEPKTLERRFYVTATQEQFFTFFDAAREAALSRREAYGVVENTDWVYVRRRLTHFFETHQITKDRLGGQFHQGWGLDSESGYEGDRVTNKRSWSSVHFALEHHADEIERVVETTHEAAMRGTRVVLEALIPRFSLLVGDIIVITATSEDKMKEGCVEVSFTRPEPPYSTCGEDLLPNGQNSLSFTRSVPEELAKNIASLYNRRIELLSLGHTFYSHYRTFKVL